jgi:hypothetical protein
MSKWSRGDVIFVPSVGLEGEVVHVVADRVQICWSDDVASWEDEAELQWATKVNHE